MVKQGLSAEEAASRFYVLDHQGLITAQVLYSCCVHCIEALLSTGLKCVCVCLALVLPRSHVLERQGLITAQARARGSQLAYTCVGGGQACRQGAAPCPLLAPDAPATAPHATTCRAAPRAGGSRAALCPQGCGEHRCARLLGGQGAPGLRGPRLLRAPQLSPSAFPPPAFMLTSTPRPSPSQINPSREGVSGCGAPRAPHRPHRPVRRRPPVHT